MNPDGHGLQDDGLVGFRDGLVDFLPLFLVQIPIMNLTVSPGS